MKDLLRKYKDNKLSRANDLHQNRTAEYAIKKVVVTIAKTIIMLAALRCTKHTFSTYFSNDN